MVHGLQLRDGILFDGPFDGVDALAVVGDARVKGWQANHVERFTGLQRAVNVVVLPPILGFV